MYDVSKLLGITVQTAERHYTSYVEELRERARKLVDALDFVGNRGTDVTQPSQNAT